VSNNHWSMENQGRESPVEQDEEVCRICRGSEKPLFHPCKCSGSIRFVHEKCLQKWINQCNATHCELCNYEFEFLKVYKKPKVKKCTWRYILARFTSLFSNLGKLGKYLLAAILWLIVLPFATYKFLQYQTGDSINPFSVIFK
jgi:E3 ubiquitin-protein ligase DOA10